MVRTTKDQAIRLVSLAEKGYRLHRLQLLREKWQGERPAVRIVGELDQYKEPHTARLEYQDWFTPWVEFDEAKEEDLLQYAGVFYYGD